MGIAGIAPADLSFCTASYPERLGTDAAGLGYRLVPISHA